MVFIIFIISTIHQNFSNLFYSVGVCYSFWFYKGLLLSDPGILIRNFGVEVADIYATQHTTPKLQQQYSALQYDTKVLIGDLTNRCFSTWRMTTERNSTHFELKRRVLWIKSKHKFLLVVSSIKNFKIVAGELMYVFN